MSLAEMLGKRIRVNLKEGDTVYGTVVEVDIERECIKLLADGAEEARWINGTRIQEIIM